MIKFLFLLNTFVCLGISLFLIINFFKSTKKLHLKKALFLFLLMGLVFLLPSIVFLSWSFNLAVYNFNDLLFIHSIIVFFEAILLLIIIYQLRKNKKIFYLLFIYLIFILSFLMGLDFSTFLLISSLLFIMILFIILISIPYFSRISKSAILYTSVSIFLQIPLLIRNEFSSTAILISNLFFFIFLLFFIKDLKTIPQISYEKNIKLKYNRYIFDFLRYFVFIIILTNFIFIGVLAIHEAGHFFVSKLSPDCDLERIVYEGNLPHTEILCSTPTDSSMNRIIFGGIFLPVIVALLFFFGGGTFMKEISLLILGFDILISYKDFIDLGFSQNISIFFSIFGVIIILLAIGILAKSRTTEEEFIHLGES
jgi:hypothetical protein